MMMSRRALLAGAAMGATVGVAGQAAHGQSAGGIKAIAFDAFPIFDPRPIFALVRELYPDRGAAIVQTWLAKQFGYTWLLTSAGRYQDFHSTIEDALVFATENAGVELTAEALDRLMHAYLELNAWPDVKPALDTLRERGIRMAFLSNMTEHMLQSNMKNAGIESYFEHVLSTDRVHAFKPAPKAYQMGVDAFGLTRSEIAFAAFAGWDATGAVWFGYPTVWVNRLQAPNEQLDAIPNRTTNDLTGLVEFVFG